MRSIAGVGRALMDCKIDDSAFFKYMERALGEIPPGDSLFELNDGQAKYLLSQAGRGRFRPGGSCFNTLSLCADRFNTKYAFSCGCDELGDAYMTEVERRGILPVASRSGKPTGFVIVVEDGTRRSVAFNYGASNDVDAGHQIRDAEMLFAEGYVFAEPAAHATRKTFEDYASGGLGLTAVNFGGYSKPSLRQRMTALRDMVKGNRFDITVCNEGEYAAMKADMAPGSADLCMFGNRLSILTMAERGSMGTDGKSVHFSAVKFPVPGKVKIGAGDAYFSGLIKAISLNLGLQDAMSMAETEAFSFIRSNEA